MANGRSRGPPKLPIHQLAILAICRFAEPVALTSVFPYLPEMIESFGVEKKNVARWAGITSAAFSLSQCCTAILWGTMSDKFGRKPTILFGLTATMVCVILWGMSTSLPMAIVVRALTGACNGNVGIIRTMVAEMVTEKELQPRAFSIMPLVWSLGSIFGPSFGGFFAKPTEQMPGLFGNSTFLKKFPFALPNLVASALFMVGITTGILFLRETLESKKYKTDYGRELGKRLVSSVKTVVCLRSNHKQFHKSTTRVDETTSLLRPSTASSTESSRAFAESYASKSRKPEEPRPTLSEVLNRQSFINLVAYSFLALHSVAFDQLLPIFMHHPKQVPDPTNTSLPFKFSGGFGIGSGRIGSIFTMYGVIGCFIQFLIFPPTARKFGVLNCFKACSITFPIVCFVTPYTALIQSPNWQQGTMFSIMVVKCFAVIFAFPCSIILLTNSAVSLRILGTLNGVAVSVSAIGRALGPALSGVAFTWGLEKGYVITPYWLLGLIAAIGAIPIWYLEEMEGFGNTDEESDSEEHLNNEEAIDEVDGPCLGSGERKSDDGRKLSTPFGMGEAVGPGGGRRLSNGLAASNVGQGNGGTSFN